jgi:hypothetical protein
MYIFLCEYIIVVLYVSRYFFFSRTLCILRDSTILRVCELFNYEFANSSRLQRKRVLWTEFERVSNRSLTWKFFQRRPGMPWQIIGTKTFFVRSHSLPKNPFLLRQDISWERGLWLLNGNYKKMCLLVQTYLGGQSYCSPPFNPPNPVSSRHR